MLSRFPYRPADPSGRVMDLPALLSQLRPTVFAPQNYTLPDEILFSESERVWVQKLREAFTHVQEGRYETAEQIFAAFLEEYPEHVPTRVAHADLLYTLGDYAGAEQAYLHLLESQPNHFQALNNLAWMYSTSSDRAFRKPEKAEDLVRRAMMTSPQSHHVWSTLSQSLFARGRFEEASQASATAVNLAQRSGAPNEVLVSYLIQLDRSRLAIQATSLMN